MHRSSIHQLGNMASARDYIELISLEEEFMLYGFEPNPEFLSVHVAPFPEDSRTPGAGLFGMYLPDSWQAVGILLSGRATHPETQEVLSIDARVRVVVTRSGETCTQLFIDGNMLTEPLGNTLSEQPLPESTEDPIHPAQGLLTDCLPRMLGLPSLGVAPCLGDLVVGLWLNDLLHRAMSLDDLDWDSAVALHPGEPGEPGLGPVAPSIETITEATFRAAGQLNWERMRQRAAIGEFQATALAPEEAEWMDATMFGRWVTSAIPDPDAVLRTLRRLGADQISENITQVLHSIRQGRVIIE